MLVLLIMTKKTRSQSMSLVRCIAVALSIGALGSAALAQPPELSELFEEEWEFRLRFDPLLATSVGDSRYNDRLPSVTTKDQERRARYYRDVLSRLDALDRDSLERSDRVHYDIFRRQLEEEVDEGGWIVLPGHAADVFEHDPAVLWRDLLRALGGEYALLSNYPDDPQMN